MSTQDDQAAFFAGGGTRAGDPERVKGRYKFVDPFGNTVSTMTASNYGFPLADQYGLNKWKMRELVKGIAQRQDLIALLSVLDPGSKGKIDEIIDTALQVAGTSAEANKGTSIHEALRLADMGLPYPPMFEPFVSSYRAELQRFGLTVGLIEATVYSPGLNARGDLDRTFIESDGSHVLGDVKSTGHLEDQAHEISVQMAVYQSATHYRDDKGAWHAIPRGKHPLRDDYAIIVHVDREHATVTLYRLDLWIGKRGANLAEQVRQWRKAGPVLLPYAPPAHPTMTYQRDNPAVAEAPWLNQANPSMGRAVDTATVADRANEGAADGSVRRLPSGVAQVFQYGEWMDYPPGHPMHEPGAAEAAASYNQENAAQQGWSPTVSAAPPAPEPISTEELAANSGHDPLAEPADAAYPEVGGAGVPFEPPKPPGRIDASAEATGLPVGCGKPATLKVTDLVSTRMTKAQVQNYAREHGLTDLAHTKKVLAEELRKRGCVLGEGIVPDALQPEIHPTRTPQFEQMTLAKIGNAATVGELQVIRNDVVRQGGDQAWIPAYTKASRVKVSELDAGGIQEPVYGRIDQCKGSEDIGRLWEEITVSGKVSGNWTEAVQAYAMAHLDKLNKQAPPVTGNPFAQPST